MKTLEANSEKYIQRKKVSDFVRKFALLFFLIGLFIIFAAIEPIFFTPNNIVNILSQAAITGILAVGLTFVVISGEIDLSFGANASLSAVLSLMMVKAQVNPGLIILVAICTGLAVGIANSLVVIKLKIPALLGTIAIWMVVQGITAWISEGTTIVITRLPETIALIGRGRLLGIIPMPIIILLVVCIFAIIVINKTVLGRYFYAVGGNQIASIHAGIKSDRIKIIGFLIFGLLGGMAGLMIASRLMQTLYTSGNSYFFTAIIAVFLGSIFLKDGIPNIWGTVVAAVLLATLSNGFILAGLSFWHENFFQGVIMIASIAFITIVCKKNIKGIQL